MNIFLDRLNALGLPTEPINQATNSGSDPMPPSPFLISEAGAAVIAAIGYLAAELYHLKTKQM